MPARWPVRGRSWMHRRSVTTPSRLPAASNTSCPMRSLARMAAPGHASDDVRVDPFLQRRDLEVLDAALDGDGAADVGDGREVDPQWIVPLPGCQPAADGHGPFPEAPAESWAQGARSDQYRGDVGPAVLVDVELDVVHLADQAPAFVDDLPVEKV